MSEMIERVAKSLLKAHYERGRSIAPVWESLDKFDREMWVLSARAAIEAMREPTLKMMDDGHHAAMKVRSSGVSGMTIEAQTRAECARESVAWRAMIDAALAEIETGGVI